MRDQYYHKMAWRMNVKLPAFKVTQTSSSAPTVRRHVPRGQFTASSSQHVDVSDASDSEDQSQHVESVDVGCERIESDKVNFSTHMDCLGESVSLHTVKEQASACAWSQIRSELSKVVVESSAMPKNQVCILCCKMAQYRCIQCGPGSYFCCDCFDQAHKLVNIFHIGELWQVCIIIYQLCFMLNFFKKDGMYKRAESERIIDVRSQHKCSSVSSVPLCCIDNYGILCSSCMYNVYYTYILI